MWLVGLRVGEVLRAKAMAETIDQSVGSTDVAAHHIFDTARSTRTG